MTIEENRILTKTIAKIIDTGWTPQYLTNNNLRGRVKAISGPLVRFTEGMIDYRVIIFDQTFAKALWGDPYVMTWAEAKESGYRGGAGGQLVDLQKGAGSEYHLQQMIIAPNAIQYLGANQ